jgi:hypothetical protein
MMLMVTKLVFAALLTSVCALNTSIGPLRKLRVNGISRLGLHDSESTQDEIPASEFEERVRHFINLTNGIEAVGLLQGRGVSTRDIQFIRLQSTHCEHAQYSHIINGLDYNFLMSLALGHICLCYDFGSRGTGLRDEREGIPRAFWWGLEWVSYCLIRTWGLRTDHTGSSEKQPVMVKGYNVQGNFAHQYEMLPKLTKKRLKYFMPYVKTDKLYLYPLYAKVGAPVFQSSRFAICAFTASFFAALSCLSCTMISDFCVRVLNMCMRQGWRGLFFPVIFFYMRLLRALLRSKLILFISD